MVPGCTIDAGSGLTHGTPSPAVSCPHKRERPFPSFAAGDTYQPITRTAWLGLGRDRAGAADRNLRPAPWRGPIDPSQTDATPSGKIFGFSTRAMLELRHAPRSLKVSGNVSEIIFREFRRRETRRALDRPVWYLLTFPDQPLGRPRSAACPGRPRAGCRDDSSAAEAARSSIMAATASVQKVWRGGRP